MSDTQLASQSSASPAETRAGMKWCRRKWRSSFASVAFSATQKRSNLGQRTENRQQRSDGRRCGRFFLRWCETLSSRRIARLGRWFWCPTETHFESSVSKTIHRSRFTLLLLAPSSSLLAPCTICTFKARKNRRDPTRKNYGHERKRGRVCRKRRGSLCESVIV
jgi:hypothetical protein